MSLSMTHLSQDPAFERFLCAIIGADRRATDVTVLSMLARLIVDPWGQPSELATMSAALRADGWTS